MAIIEMEGWDHYGTGATGQGNIINCGSYSSVATGTGPATVVSGRTGNAIQYGTPAGDSSGSVRIRRAFGATYSQIGVGFAHYANLWGNGTVTDRTFVFLTGGINRSTGIRITAQGRILVLDGGNNNIIGQTAEGVILPLTWQYIELFSDSSAGTVELRLNGQVLLILTSVSVPGPISGWECGRTAASASSYNQWRMDDMVFWDTSGTVNNTFLGDRRVLTLYPTADASPQDWTPVGASNGFAAINQTDQDADSTYITIADPGVSAFEFQDIDFEIGDVAGIQVNSLERKDDAGDVEVRVGVISGADTINGASRTVNTSYTQRFSVFETDPANPGNKFTRTSLNAAKVKIERVS